MTKNTPHSRLKVSAKLPGMQYRQDRQSGRIMFRYAVKDETEFPGFDENWRAMSEAEQRETLRMGGRVAEWLKSLTVEGAS